MEKYSVIDLFAGAGGLSLGFVQTNKFNIKVAVESNPYARETFRRNHECAELLLDVCSIDYEDLIRRYGQFDVVIGGPPCQGFSNANRQKNQVISMNNRLVKEYVKAVCRLQPKVFVMENVDMLRSKSHRFYYAEGDQEIIESLKIDLADERIELLPPYVYVSNADKLIGDYELIERVAWDEPIYLTLNVLFKQRNNPQKLEKAANRHAKKLNKIHEKLASRFSADEFSQLDRELAEAIKSYLDGTLDSLQHFIEKMEKSIYIQRMISKLKELRDNMIAVEYETGIGIYAHVKSYAVLDYIKKVLASEPHNYKISDRVLNAASFGVPQKRMRFIIMGAKNVADIDFDLPEATFSEEEYRTVRDAIGDLEDIEPAYEVKQVPYRIPRVDLAAGTLIYALRDTDILNNHVMTKSTPTALKRFGALTEGQNFHDLKSEMKEDTYTDVSRTQNTIYLRLRYDEPSGTVLNIRKSMWIHPMLDRALSIREAARLQTFPDSFIFTGTKDAQYQQVGNAVPPLLANAIAQKTLELL